ncbi:MAG: amino acid/polyamine/organocation transporter, superfamily [Gemmatimonadetes bacterium]|nr:amino acid/polyamine/organocation transporter, superfamily [Gemmatimonadota bacterium]
MGLWSTKSLDAIQAEASMEGQHTLKRVLTATNLVFLGIGAIIGAGIFVLTGTAAANNAGPAVVLSFVLAGLGCLFAGLCYAEFASMIPVAGSAYTYAYATLGELVAWIIGWDLILEYLFGASTVAVGWSGYFSALLHKLGIDLGTAWTTSPYKWIEATTSLEKVPGGMMNVPAFLLVLAMTCLLVVGIKESARFNNVIVFVKVAIVFMVIGFGFMFVNTANWHPFIPPAEGPGHYGWSGIVRAAGVVFFAYIGFDAVSTAAQEAKNPQRDMPIGMLGSLAFCTVLYILMSLVMTGLAPYKELAVPHPVDVALAKAPALAWLNYLVDIGAIAGLASVVLVMLMGQPRIFFTMARDGLLPPVFGKVHPRFQTPYVTTILTGTLAAIIAAFFPIDLLGELVSIGTLFAFVVVSAGVLALRYQKPDIPRPFKTPLVPLVPLLGMGICLYLMWGLPGATWERLAIWLVLGLVIYFAYGRTHSRITTGNPTPISGN